jgi:hypothetical protein
MEKAAGTRSFIVGEGVGDTVAELSVVVLCASSDAPDSSNSVVVDGSSFFGVFERHPNLLNLDKPLSDSYKMR